MIRRINNKKRKNTLITFWIRIVNNAIPDVPTNNTYLGHIKLIPIDRAITGNT